MRLCYLSLLFLLIISCGASKEEEVERALVSASNALTESDCDAAINSLASVSYQTNNAEYVKLYASAYACLAGYKTTTFFDQDITKISGSNILSEFTTFTLAQRNESGVIDASFQNMQTAIDALMYSSGIPTSTNPTSALRNQEFSNAETAEINSLLFYLLVNQLGSYFYFYGNTNSTGVKGGGEINNQVCLYNYDIDNDTNNALDSYLSNQSTGGSCNATGLVGSAQLTDGSVMNVSRACRAITLFNALFDTFENITISSIGEDDLSIVFSGLKNILDKAGDYAFTDNSILSITSQTLCETNFASNDRDLQLFFAIVFEALHNKQ